MVLSSCGGNQPSQATTGPGLTPGAGSTTIPATATPLPPASSASVADRFLKAWQESRFEDMYDLTSAPSHQSIAKDKFVQRYRGIAAEATIQGIAYNLSKPSDNNALEVPYTITITTKFFGDITESRRMPLVKEDDWKVAWTPSQIFDGLEGDNLIHMFVTSAGRGAILDRKGQPLAVDTLVPSVGVVPGQIKDRAALIQNLAKLLNMDAETVTARISVQANPDWFVPVKILPYGTPEKLIADLRQLPGVSVRQESRRNYPLGMAAAHAIGYVTKTTADDLKKLGDQGYTEDDWLGRSGIEKSEESVLSGARGGQLAIVSPSGAVQKVIAEKAGTPPADVYLTIDGALQQKVENLLADNAGSIVVIDPRDNSILALASHPGFDPNGFVRGLTAAEWKALSEGQQRPLLDRPLHGAYPPGSLFKVVTMAAGLEKGGFTPASTFACTPTWTGLPGTMMTNWRPEDRGMLDFVTGLAESCNPVFYEVGKKLDQVDPNILPNIARGFGLGKPTDVQGLEEASGLVPDPSWKKSAKSQPWYTGDTVNMAIGQGFVLATPLQMANLFSSVAAGQLRTPVLIQKIQRKDETLKTYTAQKQGDLPVSEANLKAVRQGLTAVINDQRGTAYATFLGAPFKAAGKSGTAEDEGKDSHAWFVAMAPADNPQVVALVMLEEGGMGSKQAGPIARKVLEAFFGK